MRWEKYWNKGTEWNEKKKTVKWTDTAWNHDLMKGGDVT